MIAAFDHIAKAPGRRVTRRRQSVRIRIGVPSKHFLDETEKNVARNFWRALDRMKASEGFSVVEVPTDSSYERFTTARAAIQLRDAAWFYEELVKSKRIASHMNADVVTLLRRGLRVGQIRYLGANLVRLESVRVFGRLLKGLDALAMPTTRMAAPRLADIAGKEAGRLRKLLLQNTEVFNLSGFPALSIPTNPGGGALPTAIQFACRLGEDPLALQIGELAMQAIAR